MKFDYLFYGWLAAAAAVVLFNVGRCGNRSLAAIKAILSGVASMMAVNAVGSFTSCFIPVNYVTVFVCSVLGLPGTLMLLISKLIL